MPRTPRARVVLGRADVERSIDAEDRAVLARRALALSRGEARATPPLPPSAPVVAVRRCAVCAQWPRFGQRGGVRVCLADGGSGHPYAPQPAVGLAVVR